MTPAFVVRHAVRSLVRGGQRSLLAIVCVATGVASLVSLQLLATMIGASIGVDGRAVVGGDASLSPQSGRFDGPAREALNRLVSDGSATAVTLLSERPSALLTHSRGGRAHFLNRLVGIDPTTFPLVGTVELRDSSGTHLQTLLEQPQSAIVTRDIADRIGVSTGDEVIVGGGPDGPPASLYITAIAELTPDRRGNTVYVSLDTARLLAAREDVITSVSVLWSDTPPSAEQLASEGWDVTTPVGVDQERQDVVKLFGTMLKGAGILGLLLGGIGVTNTMNVLLVRRRGEIATLKAIGYERRHLLVLFGLEAGFLGLAGGIVGSTVGVVLSAWLRVLLGRTGPILLEQSFSPATVAGGVAIGVATAVIFGLHAIIRASAVRPSTLFRDLPTPIRWPETVALGIALGGAFASLASIVLGSVLYGAAVVAIGFVGLGLLLAALGAMFFGVVSVPVPLPGLVAMAHANLRRTPGRALVALVALFCGVFTIGFAAGTLQNAADRFASRSLPSDGINLVAYSSAAHSESIANAIAKESPVAVERTVTASGAVEDHDHRFTGIRTLTGIGAELPSAVALKEGDWKPDKGLALLPDRYQRSPFLAAVGDTLSVRGSSGVSVEVRIGGFYGVQPSSPVEPRPSGAIVDASVVERVGGAGVQHVFAAKVAADDLDRSSTAVASVSPGSIVLSRRDFNEMLIGAIRSLFGFVVAVAGFALAAGAVLIANAAALVMVERRREIGVLKAIGFSSRRVLATVAVEFATLGLVAGASGIAAVALAFVVLNRVQPNAHLSLGPWMSAAMIGISAAIALVSSIAASWAPARCRPLDVLRQD